MKKRMPGLFAYVLFGLLAIAACSSGTPTDGGTGTTDGGEGGSVSTAGAPHAGRGGATAHAGSSSKAGAAQGGASSAEGGEAGEGGGAGAPAGPQCPQCKSGFCFKDGTCVDCLPALDNCPSGTVCGSSNTCVPGCKVDGTSCESGVCADSKNCQSCIGDDECGGGNVCGDNQCAAKCTAGQEGTSEGCSAGHTCCSLHCIDLNTDSQHCGVCGTACGAGQFCGPAACTEAGAAGAGGDSGACVSCHDIAIANVCSVPQVAVILDGADGNEAAGRALAAAIAAQCTPAPVIREVSQTVTDALNPASGRPISGAHELLIAAGGSFFARLLVYLDSKRVSPIYSYSEGGTLEFRKAANDETVVARQASEPNDDHDFFVIQFLREPTSGSIILNAQGFWLSGTVAASYFFEKAMLPHLSDFDKGWYVYEWQDKNGDKAPDLDEMSEVASGN
ncbi:MAG: hypothetical protein ABUL62_26620 [Myxococcales bacterium]